MRLPALLGAGAILASTGLASPFLGERSQLATKDCLAAQDAKDIVNVYKKLIANYTDADCTNYCADTFVDTSDSINSFLNQQLGKRGSVSMVFQKGSLLVRRSARCRWPFVAACLSACRDSCAPAS